MKLKFLIFFIALGAISFALVYKKPQNKPRASIITSVYAGDEFIEGFMEDITSQTIFDQCELIMINANSPGNEEPIIRKYMSKYPNITYVKFEHDPGIYGVWNRAIQMAKSDIVTNANLDDRSHPKALEVLVEALEKDPAVDLVYAEYLWTSIPNETFETTQSQAKGFTPEFSIQNMSYVPPGPRPVWRKSLHDRYGYFSEIFFSAGDVEMWLRAVSQGSKFKKVPGCYTLYYENPKGLSTDKDVKKAFRRRLESDLVGQKYSYLFSSQ